jgi:hypothetical protein
MKRIRLVLIILLALPLIGMSGIPFSLQADTGPAAGSPRILQAEPPPGYSALFAAKLAEIGQITPEEFSRRYASKAEYLPRLTWDPTTARFWKEFNNPMGTKGAPGGLRKKFDFSLDEREKALFLRNGFVVSERLGSSNCTEMFYRIYERDLPVFISADAVLHAWHRTYDKILEEVEVCCLSPTLDLILKDMAEAIPKQQRTYGKGVLADSLTDADFFLAVARSLLTGQQVHSKLGQEERVSKVLAACAREQLEAFPLFGRVRKVDFSQFKPRGHYENSPELRRYFQAMMWCGRIDLRVAGNAKYASPRELGAALVLHDLLQRSGSFARWQCFDRVVQTFVGQSDSMTFAHLDALVKECNVCSLADIRSLDTLSAIQKKLLAGDLGLQHIRGHVFESSPDLPEKVQLPRSFTFLGQRFTLDNWVTAKIVYDEILWDDEKVMRRIPSCLDVAFAALGNDSVVPELVQRMHNPAGRKFRDGLAYQHNLSAAREVISALKKETWTENLYTGWLGCLRTLSAPTTDRKYPEAMRTRAWAMKSLNTQLASWAQLRHDTILYAKQSYTVEVSCFYPAGYVEPIPHFWGQLEGLANRAADLIERTPYPDREVTLTPHAFGVATGNPRKVTVEGKGTQQQHVQFLRNFAKSMGMLRDIARRELDQQELTEEQVKFIKQTVQLQLGCGGPRRYTGWYPRLFYGGSDSATKWDALVSDVHTDVPSPIIGDPGCVLHQGVGNMDLLMIAIDSGKDRMIYAGPVLSHYEFEMPGVSRLADSQWKKQLQAGNLPNRPPWTEGYLVPGRNPEAGSYK